MKVYAIIAAGGKGERFRKSEVRSQKSEVKETSPKQFLKLNNKPVILYSLLAFQRCKVVNHIIVTANKKFFGFIKKLSAKHNITKLTDIVEGGKTRFESVRNAFRKINANEAGIVLIHDAVRPLIESGEISKIISETRKHGAAVYAIKVNDTVKRVRSGNVVKTVSREDLWQVQTPQAFRYRILARAYSRHSGSIHHTDEASLVESSGRCRIRVIEGKQKNIKITTPEHAEIARLFI